MSARVRSLIVSALVTGALAGPGSAAALASISITAPADVPEANTGTSQATYTVSRSCPALGGTASVMVTSAAVTATAGSDYQSLNQAVSFNNCVAPTTQTQPVQVTINGDTRDEPDETFDVVLGTPSGDTLGSPTTQRTTILDDDPVPAVSIGGVSSAEGTAASPTSLSFPVTLSAASGRTVTVQYATTAGSATEGGDFTATSGTLTIPAGQLGGTIGVPVAADNLDEPDETLTMTLSTPSNATLGTATGTGTILNDDVPTVSIGNVSITETNANQTVGFPVTLSNPSARTITVAFATVDDSAKAASDYTANNGTVTFAPGETAQTIAIEILGDTLTEKAEAFGVVLSASNGTATGIGRITDDDVPAATGTPAAGNDVGFGAGVLPGAGADTTPPAIKVSRPTLARSGVLKLTVACQAGEKVCRGTVTVFSRPAPKSKVKALRGEVKIGKTNFVIPGGKDARLTLRLSKRVLGLLRRARTVRVTAFVVGRDAAGNIGTTQKPGTLRRPRR